MFRNPALRAPVAVSLGAIAGALSRYYGGGWIDLQIAWDWPLGTLCVNLVGCLAMGLLATLPLERWGLSVDVRLLLTTGFLGALTTFSAFELETLRLLTSARQGGALAYGLGSAVLGVGCFLLGSSLARAIQRRDEATPPSAPPSQDRS